MEEGQGSFKLLRSFLGTIAGGLSSLASIPFGKRKQPEAPLLIEASPGPPSVFAGLDQTGDNLHKLYPDMELSETRKRARLSLDGVTEYQGECSKENVKGLGETSEEVNLGSGKRLDGCEVSPIRLDEVSCGADETLGDCDVTAFSSDGVSHGENMTLDTPGDTDVTAFGSDAVSHDKDMSLYNPDDFDGLLHDGNETLHIPHGSDEKDISGQDEILHYMGEDFDQNLASFRRTLLARKTKQQKRGQDSSEEDIPRKKVRFGNSAFGLSDDNELHQSAHTLSMDMVEFIDIPRKKVRFGNSAFGLSDDNELHQSAHTLSMDMVLKKCTSAAGLKRKRGEDVEDKNEKKLRALTLTEEPARTEGKVSMVGMAGVSTRKRERVKVVTDKSEKKLRASTFIEEPVRTKGKVSTVGMTGVSTRKRERVGDDSALVKTVDEEEKLRKAVFVENLPLNASRKAISKEFSQFGAVESMRLQSVFFQDEKTRRKPIISGELNKTPNSQNAHIVYKDELSAKAALAHNMKEFDGNCIHVLAAAAHETLKETASAAMEDAWSIFVSNTPTDVKDEELHHLFGSEGSLNLDVKAVRVMRDPHSGLSKGTAYVFFKTEADVNRLLSSRHPLKLRDRVIRVSRVSHNAQAEQRFTPPRLAKGLIISEADESEKRVKLSLPHENVTTTKEFMHQGKQTLTRSKRSDLSTEDHIKVHVLSSPVYATRQVAASREQSKSLEDSPEAKRKRVEKHQRGISRSKKIRRT